MIMHPAIKLRHIRAFLDIAAEGNMTIVAKAQGITQPALSRTLAELESLLGAPLFYREGRKLVLTPSGKLFRQHASVGVQAFERAVSALSVDRGEGRLEVGVLPSVATRLFPRVALLFNQMYPQTVLSVTTGPNFFLLNGLRRGTQEIMLGRMPRAEEMADLTFEHLYDEDVLLVARAGHPMAGATAEQAVARSPIILPPEGALIRRAVDDYLISIGLGTIRPAFETVALPLGRRICLDSNALWFISKGVILEELDRGELVALPTGKASLAGAIGITRRREAENPQPLDSLCQLLRDAVRDGLNN